MSSMNRNVSVFEKMWEAANYYPLFLDIGMIYPVETGMKKIFGTTQKKMLLFASKSFLEAYYEKTEMRRAAQVGWRKFTNKRFLRRYMVSLNSIKEQARAYFEKEKIDASRDFVGLFFCGVRIQKVLMSYFSSTQPEYLDGISKFITEELIRTQIPPYKQQAIKNLMLAPSKISSFSRERLEWLRALMAYKSEKHYSVEQFLFSHWNTYRHLSAIDGGRPHSVDYYRILWKKEKQAPKEKFEVEYYKIKRSIFYNARKKKSIIKKYYFTPKLLFYFKIAETMGFERFENRFLWMKMDYILKLLLRRIASQKNLKYNDLLFYRETELKSLPGDKKNFQVPHREIQARKKAFVFLLSGDKFLFHSGESAEKIKKKYIKKSSIYNNLHIQGQSAYSGVYRGKIYCVRWGRLSKNKMRRGDILVAGQTRPALMPLIRLAGAIVTDEGGITSHAAIVARELHIPCIIGTKNATKILKTNDLVEVDANQGVVTVIKRNKKGK